MEVSYSEFEVLLKERKRLESIIRITERVHSFKSLQDVYSAIIDSAVELENVDMVMIYLVDEERKEAVLKAWRNVPEDYLRRASRIAYPRGSTWKVINTGKVLNIPDAQKDPDIGPAGRDLGHHGVLGVPVFSDGKVIGVIWFLSYRECEFSEDEVKFLSILGTQVAIAISKAKMIEDLMEYARMLESTREQLIQAEKMASLGRLTSGIAHEINNPLTPILGYCEFLLSRVDLDEEKRRKYLEFIYECARRIDRIVKGLLSYSRGSKLEVEPVDVNSVVERVLRFREYQLNLADIEVIRDLGSGLPLVMANPTQLEQVFLNIVLNAEHALGLKDGRRRLVVRTGVRDGGVVEVIFSDNGPGMSKEVVDKVFEPFFTTKSGGEGSGLGLFIVYEVIRRHGGRVRVESEEGRGATFVVELPCVKGGVSTGKGENLGKDRGEVKQRGRVLVVEDEKLIGEMIREVLEGEGYFVFVAGNGRIALERLEEEVFDLIICDVKMPCMDGNRLYREVRDRYGVSEDRFIFITGDIESLSSEIDRDRVLKKPFTVEELKSKVNSSFYRLIKQ
jgi:signal transduction histidine kinase